MYGNRIRTAFSAPFFILMVLLHAVPVLLTPGFSGFVGLFYLFTCVYIAAVQFMKRRDIFLLIGAGLAGVYSVLRLCSDLIKLFDGSSYYNIIETVMSVSGSVFCFLGVAASAAVVILSIPLGRGGEPFRRRGFLRKLKFVPYLAIVLGYTLSNCLKPSVQLILIPASALIALPWLLLCGWVTNPYEREPLPVAPDYPLPVDQGRAKMTPHILLTLFTGPVWPAIWIYKTTRKLNGLPGIKDRKPLACLFLCLVPFYWLVWVYRSSKRIDMISRIRGVESDVATENLMISYLFGGIGLMIMQKQINQLVSYVDSNTVQ